MRQKMETKIRLFSQWAIGQINHVFAKDEIPQDVSALSVSRYYQTAKSKINFSFYSRTRWSVFTVPIPIRAFCTWAVYW